MTPYLLIGISFLILSLGMMAYCLLKGFPDWFGWFLAVIAFCALIAVSGCSSIDYSRKPPEDWPKLEVIVKPMNFFQKQEACGIPLAATVLFGYFCLEVATVDFCTKTCTVSSPTDHELAHCSGRDHSGASTMSDAWSAYKQMHGNHHCRFRLGTERYCRLWPEDKVIC